MYGVVALVEGLDPQPQHVERCRPLLGLLAPLVDVRHLTRELLLADREVVLSLGHGGELELGLGKPSLQVVLLAGGLLALARYLVQLIGEPSGPLLGGLRGCLVPLDLLARLARARRSGLASLGHLGSLGLRLADLRLKATDLRRDGRQLAGEARDLALSLCAPLAGGGETRLGRGDRPGGIGKGGLQLAHPLAEGADASLALEGALLGVGREPHVGAPVGQDGDPLRRHEREPGSAGMGFEGGAGIGDHADPTQHRRDQPVGVVAHAQPREKGLPGQAVAVRVPPSGLVHAHDGGAALCFGPQGGLGKPGCVVTGRDYQCPQVVAQQALHHALQLVGRLHEVGEAAPHQAAVWPLREGCHQLGRVLRLLVHGLKGPQVGAGLREPRAALLLRAAGSPDLVLARPDGVVRLALAGAGRLERRAALLLLRPALRERLGRGGKVVGDLV